MKSMFLKPDDLLLKKVAEEADPESAETGNIIKTMLKIAQIEQKGKKKPIMVGLAAPQIGILKRIILVDVEADGKGLPATPRKLGLRGGRGDLRVYINPEIIWKSKKEGEWYEGCYSTGLPATPRKLGLRGGRGNICGIVSRPVSVKIKAFGVKEEKFTGYTARIFQHEIDHLNGKLFTDLITNPDHLHLVEKKEFAIYRNKEAWRNWSKKASLPLAIGSLKRV